MTNQNIPKIDGVTISVGSEFKSRSGGSTWTIKSLTVPKDYIVVEDKTVAINKKVQIVLQKYLNAYNELFCDMETLNELFELLE